MTSEMPKIGDLKLKPVLRVSQRGKGLYMYLPDDLVKLGDIRPGDRIECELLRHYRPPPKYLEESP